LIKFDSNGDPFLEGFRCGACDEVFLESHRGCPRCFAAGSVAEHRLGTTGTLYNYTIVCRSFPGVAVPFISAIVDLDGGGTLMGNLLDIPADPHSICFDMPVRIVFRDVGQKDKAGDSYLAYYFVPREQTP